MAKKVEETKIEVFDNMDSALSKGEAFLEKNQKNILIGLGAVAFVVIAAICYYNFYLTPREQTAKEEIYKAEDLFKNGAFEAALNGDDEVVGFLDIIDEYGGTEAGNVAKAYAGLCYKQLGDNEKALKYLAKFDADEKFIQPAILGAMGDCYWDSNDVKKAISYYKKAAESANNEAMTPFYYKRAAIAYLSINENGKATELLEKIVKEYPYYTDMNEVKKYLELAK